MTSKLTRERIELIANFHRVMALPTSHAEIEELARMALAAMEGESHTDDELSNLLWYSQEATCHSDPNYSCEFQRLATPGLVAGIILELQERRKAAMDGEPVAEVLSNRPGNDTSTIDRALPVGTQLYRHAQPVPVVSTDLLHTAASAIEDLLTTKDRAGAGVWFDLPFRLRSAANAQPAPVVVPNGLRLALSNAGIAAPESDEMLAATCEKHIQALVAWVRNRKPFQSAPVVPEEANPDSIEILASARRRDHAVFQWDEDQRNAAADSWNACRAAMLAAAPQEVKGD